MSKEPKTTEAYLMEMLTEFLRHDFNKESVLAVSYELCKQYAEKIDTAALAFLKKEVGQG